MSPFQEFRSWLRHGQPAERFAAAVAVLAAVAVGAWLVVPGAAPNDAALGATTTGSAATGTGATDAATSAGTGPSAGVGGTTAAGDAAGTGTAAGSGAGTSAAGAAAGPGAAAATGTSGAGCKAPPGSGPGISATQLKVAVTLTEIAGFVGNSALGVAPVEEQQKYYETMVDATNKEGGVGCRKLVAKYYKVNPIDRDGMHAICLNIAEEGVFAVLDTGSYVVTGPDCFAQHKIPYIGAFFVTERQRKQFFPFVFGSDTFDHLYRNTVFALKDRGFFDPANGFKKLGVIYENCNAELWPESQGFLREAGVKDSDVVTYNFGCPSAPQPNDVAQAILTFQRAGVTHLLPIAGGEATLYLFTPAAQQQRFKPVYGVPDSTVIVTAYGSQPPDKDNMDGAVAITDSRTAEERTPGMVPTAGTKRCDAILGARGIPPTWKAPAAAGNTCNQFWMVQAAVNNASSLRPEDLVVGLQRAKSIDFSYPQGANDFTKPGTTTGGQGWRVAQFTKDCACWKLIQRDFRPSY
jgi:hypothetical protein